MAKHVFRSDEVQQLHHLNFGRLIGVIIVEALENLFRAHLSQNGGLFFETENHFFKQAFGKCFASKDWRFVLLDDFKPLRISSRGWTPFRGDKQEGSVFAA